MATNALTITGGMRINRVSGGLPPESWSHSKTIDQTYSQQVSGMVACTTTPAAISTSGITEKGFVTFTNLSTTTVIKIECSDDATNWADHSDVLAWGGLPMPPIKLADGSSYRAKTASGTATLHYTIHGA